MNSRQQWELVSKKLKARSTQWATIGGCIAAIGIAALVFELAAQNRILKAELDTRPSATALSRSGNRFPSGTRFPVVELQAPDGSREDLDSILGGTSVVAFLTTTCPYCAETLPVWTELADAVAERGSRFVAISLHSPARTFAYKDATGIEWPLWVVPPEYLSSFNIGAVPLTVAYAADRGTLKAWFGTLGPEQVSEVLAVIATAGE